MNRRIGLVLLLAFVSFAAVKGQPVTPAAAPPMVKGVLKKLVLTDSKIYPGTVHEISVYIPAGYDAATPACVYVQTDGLKDGAGRADPQLRFLQAMDQLIDSKEMPMTIGVFIRPGDLPPMVKGTVGMSVRSFEYDAVNDSFARFLNDEVLPLVASSLNLKLSTDAKDRAVGGQSTGGAAAFNAVFLRPDLFSRAYVCSGSFVAFRGANEYPTLIRKIEARPIRAFLTAGDHDFETCAGDWTSLNQEMDTALKFSGYDYKFLHLHGGHCIGYADSFPDAMRFIWKDWPAAVPPGKSAPRAQDILIPGETWQLVDQGYPGALSPVGNARGEVLFIDSAKNKIMRIGLDGKISEFLADAGQASGLAIGADGTLYTVSTSTGKIVAYDASGTASLYATGIRGSCAVARSDGLYVSAPGDAPGDPGKIWLVTRNKQTVVDSGTIPHATSFALRPDLAFLSVADDTSHWVYTFLVKPDGTLADPARYFWLHVRDEDDNAGAASIIYDQDGRLYVATRFGIQVCAWDGPTQVILPMPDRSRVVGISLGGPSMDTLFAFTENGKIWQRKVKGHAVGAFSPWSKMNPGKL
jgi:enterochelin esterase-like enzyme/sugar lactone lactonase YvrE